MFDISEKSPLLFSVVTVHKGTSDVGEMDTEGTPLMLFQVEQPEEPRTPGAGGCSVKLAQIPATLMCL